MKYFTEAGFIKKNVDEILDDSISTIQEIIDQPIDLSPSSIMGNYEYAKAYQVSLLYDLIEETINQHTLDGSSGVFLDNIGFTKHNLYRKLASYTKVLCVIDTEVGGVINKDLKIGFVDREEEFESLLEEDLIGNGALASVVYFVFNNERNPEADVLPGTYSFYILNHIITVTFSIPTDQGMAFNDLLNEIESIFGSLVSGERDIDDEGNYYIKIFHTKYEYLAFTAPTNITVLYIGTTVRFESMTTGLILTPPNSLVKLINPNGDILSAWNPNSAYEIGRDDETDEEFRLRIKEFGGLSGRSTIEAIESALRAVNGVTFAKVIDNKTMTDGVNGLPPKSYKVIVNGAEDEIVAKCIWEYGGSPGIEMVGDVSVTITDSEGVGHIIKFSRPSTKYLWIKNTIKFKAGQAVTEDLKPVYEKNIKNEIIKDVILENLGAKIVPNKYTRYSYEEYDDSIYSISTKVSEGTDEQPGVSYIETPFAVANNEKVYTDQTKITFEYSNEDE